MENIIVAIIAVLVVGAAVLAWWMENGPSSKRHIGEDTEKENVTRENAPKENTSKVNSKKMNSKKKKK